MLPQCILYTRTPPTSALLTLQNDCQLTWVSLCCVFTLRAYFNLKKLSYLQTCGLLWYKYCPEYSKALMGGLQDTVCCSVIPSSRPTKIHIKIYINFLITIQSYYTVMLLTASTRSNKHWTLKGLYSLFSNITSNISRNIDKERSGNSCLWILTTISHNYESTVGGKCNSGCIINKIIILSCRLKVLIVILYKLE